jgi:hypothetical protein
MEDGEMRCPRCDYEKEGIFKRKSKPEDFKLIGTSYMCDNCSYKFDKPETRHYCHDCGTQHDFKDSTYEQLFSYKVTPKIMELKPIRAIRDALRLSESILLEKGYQVELTGTAEGKSGEPREVDILARDDGRVFIIDISEWGKEEDLISLLGKKMDLEPKAAILLDLSRSEKIIQKGQVYDIKAFDAKEPEFKEKFTEYIESFSKTVRKEEPRGFFSRLFGRREEPVEPEPTPPVTPMVEPMAQHELVEETVHATEEGDLADIELERAGEPNIESLEHNEIIEEIIEVEEGEDSPESTKEEDADTILSKQEAVPTTEQRGDEGEEDVEEGELPVDEPDHVADTQTDMGTVHASTQAREQRGFFSRLFGRRSEPVEKETEPELSITQKQEITEQQETRGEPQEKEIAELADEEEKLEAEELTGYSKVKLYKMLKADLQDILITEFEVDEKDVKNLTKAGLIDVILEKQEKVIQVEQGEIEDASEK